jgi:hypothetical protein
VGLQVSATTARKRSRAADQPRRTRRWLWFNGLALVTFSAFVLFVLLQAIFGWQVHNQELVEQGAGATSFVHYLGTGHFAEAVFENWESEFLQMGSYVLLTAYLVQRGSPESKDLDGKDRPGDDRANAGPDAPYPVKRGGWRMRLYRNSLSIAMLSMFALSFLGHLIAGTADYNEQQAAQSGAAPISWWRFSGTADFWFQSMQNWQSEFLAVGALVVLGIFLRQHGSPQSKPVTEPHASTGSG